MLFREKSRRRIMALRDLVTATTRSLLMWLEVVVCAKLGRCAECSLKERPGLLAAAVDKTH
jgi:hypothetical protein